VRIIRTGQLYNQILEGGENVDRRKRTRQLLSIFSSDIYEEEEKKNYLPNIATDGTSSGVTRTVNADGSITLHGTATANANIYLVRDSSGWWDEIPDGVYILTGCPGGGGASTYRLILNYNNSESFVTDTGSGASFEKYGDDGKTHDVYIRFNKDTVFNGETFYPMIRKAGTSPEYVPY